jgi:hypothetical protein
VKLHLLIDTSVWLAFAKDYRQLPILDALSAMIEAGQLALILPRVVVDEFERNKERVIADSKRRLSSHFKLVREAMLKFAPDAALGQLNDVDHRIATSGEAINDAIEIIERLFATTTQIEPTDAVKVRAADRAIMKVAPFHRQRNGMDDAILIEIYIDALAGQTSGDDVYGFITHNIHDFSERGGDTRLPHADLAPLFDGVASRYATSLGPLLGEYAEGLLEEVRFDREYNRESRKLSELLQAEHTLFAQVWYNRHWNLRSAIERGEHDLVTREEWEELPIKCRNKATVNTVWERALAAAMRTEEELGSDNIGPWDDFEWGMLNGKLSAIRWMLGDEWDMLDT